MNSSRPLTTLNLDSHANLKTSRLSQKILTKEMNHEAPGYAAVMTRIIGCAMSVHVTLGGGFEEEIYQNAMDLEMQVAELDFVQNIEMPVHYRNEVVGTRRVAFLVEKQIYLELKAIPRLEDFHIEQANHYLEALNLPGGLLINFGESGLRFTELVTNELP